MKKFYVFLLFCGVPATILFSQNYEISENKSGTWVKIGNGTTVTRQVEAATTGVKEYFGVKNISGAARKVYVRKQVRNSTPGAVNSFCWANTCFQPDVMVSYFSYNMTADLFLPAMFKVDFEQATGTGETRITYSFFDRDHVADSAYFDILFVTSHTGIGDDGALTRSIMALPNPASSQVKFSGLGNFAGGKLILMNLLGVKVNQVSLDQASAAVTMDVTTLPDGLYLYFLETGNEKGRVSKLIIKH
jgi:hypothetical protein